MRLPITVLSLVFLAACGSSLLPRPEPDASAAKPAVAVPPVDFDVGRACAALQPAPPALRRMSTTDKAVAPTRPKDVPEKGKVFLDPLFHTCVVRATDHNSEPPKGFARNDYSRREAFNDDRSLFLAYALDGYWHLYDARSLRYDEVLPGLAGDAEPQWRNGDPTTLYYLPTNGGLKILAEDVQGGSTRSVADFSERLPWTDVNGLWTRSEGSPSRDDRYWAFQAESKFDIRGFVVYDLAQDRIVGTHAVDSRPDHVSMTPSGRWFTSSDDSTGTWAWSTDFKYKKKLHHKSEHSDIAIGANGHDIYVSIDYQSNDGDVFMVDIDACPAVPASARNAPACPRTVLFPTYLNGAAAAMHFSGKAYDKPGWVLVSTYATGPSRDGSWPWYADGIFAVELRKSPRIYGLALHHSFPEGCYWKEPQASPSRDFQRILFNSDWGRSDGCPGTGVNAYMIALPADALPTATISVDATPAAKPTH